ncbi:hypothetical protein JYU14_04950, partial [Simkania negevensis]|nr:hypothetical protein [Simkania negevensis]
KVYDIDTKEKLLDIIQSKEARENFLEFIYDHHNELEKWQQFYQERSRIRIIEWLRNHNLEFVFEEDLELPIGIVEKIKRQLFEGRVSKEIQDARKVLVTKAKTYYSSEALNPRPKRGRPPKQPTKVATEAQVSTDIYTSVPKEVKEFLHVPDITSATAITFSSKYNSEEEFLASMRTQSKSESQAKLDALSERLSSLRDLSMRLHETGGTNFPSSGANVLSEAKKQKTATPSAAAKPAGKKAVTKATRMPKMHIRTLETKKRAQQSATAKQQKAASKKSSTKATATKSVPTKGKPKARQMPKKKPVEKKKPARVPMRRTKKRGK